MVRAERPVRYGKVNRGEPSYGAIRSSQAWFGLVSTGKLRLRLGLAAFGNFKSRLSFFHF